MVNAGVFCPASRRPALGTPGRGSPSRSRDARSFTSIRPPSLCDLRRTSPGEVPAGLLQLDASASAAPSLRPPPRALFVEPYAPARGHRRHASWRAKSSESRNLLSAAPARRWRGSKTSLRYSETRALVQLGLLRAAPWESARRLREPVAKDLLRRKPAFLEPGPNRVGRFAVIFEIMGGEFCLKRCRRTRLTCELSSAPLRRSQALYLLCEVSSQSSGRFETAARRKGGRLLLGPEQKILIMKPVSLRHQPPPLPALMRFNHIRSRSEAIFAPSASALSLAHTTSSATRPHPRRGVERPQSVPAITR